MDVGPVVQMFRKEGRRKDGPKFTIVLLGWIR